ncbi:PDZ domain-containing protein [Patescibacteria group bacterium]|nr:PDZ domain-containing protein [Patescibacteria group bacterium]
MKNNNLNSIIFGTIFGLLAGVASTLLVSFYGADSLSNLNFNQEFNLNDYGYLSPNLVIRDPKKVVVNQDVKVDETIRDIKGSLLSVFVRLDNNDDYYDLNAPFANAIAATNDGWVMAIWPETVPEYLLSKASSTYVIIDSQKKIYEIDQVLFSTKNTGDFVFFHLLNANSLSVKRLLSDAEIKLGQSLILSTSNQAFVLDSLAKKNQDGLYLSSDIYAQKVSLANNDQETSAFIFNLNGDILGVIDNKGNWLLSPAIDAYWRSLLRNNNLQKASLGVSYLDLSYIINNESAPTKGALIQAVSGSNAIVKNSAAERAGLKLGDVITRINSIELNSDNNLSLIISTYNPGDNIIIDFIRGGESRQVEVVLGAI